MSGLRKVVVVGASLAGLRAVEFLRRAKFEGELLLIGDEPHLPYDRPPLSKEVLRGEWTPERIALRRKSYDELEAELLLGHRAVGLDTHAREVHLDDGARIPFDGLVIATGGTARALPNQPELAGVHTLRTLDDSLALRAELEKKPRVAVIGAGFIGAEVAASARNLGLEVTMIEALDTTSENVAVTKVSSEGRPSAHQSETDAWPWRVRCSTSPRCCCSTSPSPGWTGPRRRPSWSGCRPSGSGA